MSKVKTPEQRLAKLRRTLGPEVNTADELLAAQEEAAAADDRPAPLPAALPPEAGPAAETCDPPDRDCSPRPGTPGRGAGGEGECGDRPPPNDAAADPAAETCDGRPQSEIPNPKSQILTVPLASPREGANDSRVHVDLGLDRRQSLALRRLYHGLDESGARLAPTRPGEPGKRIANRNDALRWLLEQLQ